MSFTLLDAYPELLEKIITKLEWKSYTRLQQSCKYMKDFIQGVRKIQIEVDKYCELKPDGQIVVYGRNANYVADVDSLYGLCFQGLKFPQNINAFDVNAFEKCCELFTKYHVTTNYLPMNANYNNKEMTAKKCGTLLEILKPKRVTLNSKGCKRYLALLQAPNLKEVFLHVDPSKTLPSMRLLYSRVQKLQLFVWSHGPRSSDEVLDQILAILNVFRSEPQFLPGREFFYQDKIDDPLPSLDELRFMFADFDLTVECDNKADFPDQHLRLKCKLGYNLRNCTISLGACGALIEYNQS